MSKPFRVIQVGCGGITGAWFGPASKMDNVEYVGLVDLFPEAAQKRKDEFGLTGAEVFSDLETALRATKPDAVFDTTIPAAHTPTALLAFEHGAHVLSEKPMADTLDNARRALDASRANDRIYTVTQNYRYANGPRRLKKFLDSGALGRVSTINADMYLGAHFGGFRDQMEHVLLLDMAIHTFDMARFLSAANPVSVFCHEWNPAGSWYRHGASANAIFGMTDDVVFNFRGSWCATGLGTAFGSHWRIIGEKGTALWDGGNQIQVEVEDGDEGFFRPVKTILVPEEEFPAQSESHGSMIREFLGALDGGPLPETNAADNINSLAMVLGAVDSANAGQRLPVKI